MLGCGGGSGTCSPAAERFGTAPFSLELTALGRVGEAGLGSARTLRALTHGRRRLQPLPAASGSAPGVVYGPALARSQPGREWQHDRDVAVPAHPCLGWAAVGSTVPVPSLHPGRVGSSGHRDDVACAVRAEIREQRPACRAGVEPCVEGGTPIPAPWRPTVPCGFSHPAGSGAVQGDRGLGICWSAAAALV